MIAIDNFCRKQNPVIGFISCLNLGAAGSIFVDYGDSFMVNDPDGEEAKSFIISNITRNNKGIVTVHDAKVIIISIHYYRDTAFKMEILLDLKKLKVW